MAASETTLGVGLIAGGFMASSFFGVPLQTLCDGAIMFTLGVGGRCAFDIQRTVAAGDRVSAARVAGWAAGGLLGAPFATVLMLVAIKAITGSDPDSYTAFGLLTLGFGGQNAVSPIWQVISKVASLKFGVTIPSNLNDNGDKDVKP